MTLQFFQQEMKTLIEDFGPTEFTNHKMKMIWEFCFDLPERSFAYIIKHFIETRSVKYPPLPTHFREAALEQKKILLRENVNWDKSNEEITTAQAGEALNSYLTKIGAGSILEAIDKSKEHTL